MESKFLLERRAKMLGKNISHEKNILRNEKKSNDKPKAKPFQKIRKSAPKRAKQVRSYSKERKKFLQENPTCFFKLKGCTGKATEIHHAAGRTNERLNDQKDWTASCHNCHEIITNKLSKQDAKKIGAKK